jgi:hypothetical protein
MRLMTITNVSVDRVVQGLGGPDEDRTRLFPDTGPDTALELVDSRSLPEGVTIQVYRPTGRPQYASAPAD